MQPHDRLSYVVEMIAETTPAEIDRIRFVIPKSYVANV